MLRRRVAAVKHEAPQHPAPVPGLQPAPAPTAAPSAATDIGGLNREARSLAQQLEATRIRLDNEQLEARRQADELNVQVLQTKLQLCFEAMARAQGAP